MPPFLRRLCARTRDAELVEEIARRKRQVDLQAVLRGIDLRQARERRQLHVGRIELLPDQRDGASSDPRQIARVAARLWLPLERQRNHVPFRAHHYADEFIAPRFRRLAQIDERRGNREKALAYYSRFVELWKECDPELRPQVADAEVRLAALRTRQTAQ